MKRRIAPLVIALFAFPATALAAPSELPPRLEAIGTDVAAPDQQASTRSSAPLTAPAPAADGFDWTDAGIGGGGAAAVLAIALAGGLAVRRRQPRSPSALAG